MPRSDDGPHTRTLLPEDEQQDGAVRRPRPLRSLLIILSVVTLLVVAIAVANRDSDPNRSQGSRATDPAGPTNPTAASGIPPVTGLGNGVPKGFAHTEQGAQSAAANYAVALGSDGMFDKERRHVIVNAVYTPTVASRLKTEQDAAYTSGLLKKVGLDARGKAPKGLTFISRTVPVGSKVEKYDKDSATVSLWCTGLIGMAGVGSTDPVRTTWFTHTFELRWTDGDWKAAAVSQKRGPAPVNGDTPAAGAEEIAGAAQEYGGFTYAR